MPRALDIANALNRAHQFYDTQIDGGHFFHCSLSLSAKEGQLADQHWGAIAEDFLAGMGFTEDGGRARSAGPRSGTPRSASWS